MRYTIDGIRTPIHSYHMYTSNRDFIVDSIKRCIKPYGYFPVEPDVEIPAGCKRHRFYISHLHKGWISVTDNQYFARWELARRTSNYLPGRVVVCWGDPGEAWGYQYWEEGELKAEYVSDMWELHREWFEEEPTSEEVGRFSGNPEAMKAAFGRVGFSLREIKDIFARPPIESLRALEEFGEQIQLESGLVNFPAIDQLPVAEKFGPGGFHVLDFYQRYNVDLDDASAPDEIEFPDEIAPIPTR